MKLIKRTRKNTKLITIACILLVASLLCPGVLSCTAHSTVPAQGDTPVTDGQTGATQNESGDSPQSTHQESSGGEIAPVARDMSIIFYELDSLLLSVEPANDEWISQVMVLITDMTALCDEARQIVTGDSITDDEALFLEAVDQMDNALTILVDGIAKENIDTINEASVEMWFAMEILAQFAE